MLLLRCIAEKIICFDHSRVITLLKTSVFHTRSWQSHKKEEHCLLINVLLMCYRTIPVKVYCHCYMQTFKNFLKHKAKHNFIIFIWCESEHTLGVIPCFVHLVKMLLRHKLPHCRLSGLFQLLVQMVQNNSSLKSRI